VFSNLIGNAVRHGNAKRPINVTLEHDGSTARLCVQNYGKPIPASALPLLFNPEGRYSKYSDGKKEAHPQVWGWDYLLPRKL
jgi:signal transduction histidine kinase